MGYINHEALVKTANELPPLPQAVMRLTEIISDINYEIRDVVRVVELDPALAGKLLRMANSVMYGNGRVGAINEAVVRLGAGTVRSIAIASSLRPQKQVDLSAFGHTPTSYWQHCVSTLCFAEEMAAQRLAPFGDDFTTAALMHDFGMLVLARHITPSQLERLQELDPAIRSVDREMLVLSVNHAEVTAVVVQAWNLPETLVKAVQYHHNPGEFNHPISHGLNLANQLAWKIESRNFEYEREAESRQESMNALSLTEEQMERVLARGQNRIKLAMEVYA